MSTMTTDTPTTTHDGVEYAPGDRVGFRFAYTPNPDVEVEGTLRASEGGWYLEVLAEDTWPADLRRGWGHISIMRVESGRLAGGVSRVRKIGEAVEARTVEQILADPRPTDLLIDRYGYAWRRSGGGTPPRFAYRNEGMAGWNDGTGLNFNARLLADRAVRTATDAERTAFGMAAAEQAAAQVAERTAEQMLADPRPGDTLSDRHGYEWRYNPSPEGDLAPWEYRTSRNVEQGTWGPRPGRERMTDFHRTSRAPWTVVAHGTPLVATRTVEQILADPRPGDMLTTERMEGAVFWIYRAAGHEGSTRGAGWAYRDPRGRARDQGPGWANTERNTSAYVRTWHAGPPRLPTPEEMREQFGVQAPPSATPATPAGDLPDTEDVAELRRRVIAQRREQHQQMIQLGRQAQALGRETGMCGVLEKFMDEQGIPYEKQTVSGTLTITLQVDAEHNRHVQPRDLGHYLQYDPVTGAATFNPGSQPNISNVRTRFVSQAFSPAAR